MVVSIPNRMLGRRSFTLTAAILMVLSPGAVGAIETGLDTGEMVYRAACTTCHGADGRGATASLITVDTPPPDFTDCDFANREPDSDWVGISHDGGPSRGFSEFMPAFKGALTVEQIELAVSHIRTFCTDKRWPRGDLNLPRALVTNKAFPEDEAVWTGLIDVDKPGAFANKIVYEQRFGPRSQWEIVIPFAWLETADIDGGEDATRWSSSMGDIAVAVKHAFYHNYEKGTILSVAGEVILPTGDSELGFGNGTTVFEPFVAWGQILPADFFLQMQGGLELTADKEKAENAAFLRAAFGWTTTTGEFGRAWSPMVELTAGRVFASDADYQYSVVPQIQITLNKRQHIMFNVGLRIPVNNRDTRRSEEPLYTLVLEG